MVQYLLRVQIKKKLKFYFLKIAIFIKLKIFLRGSLKLVQVSKGVRDTKKVGDLGLGNTGYLCKRRNNGDQNNETTEN